MGFSPRAFGSGVTRQVAGLATDGGNFSSRKRPEMAINRYFLGLHAFSANFARDKIEE